MQGKLIFWMKCCNVYSSNLNYYYSYYLSLIICSVVENALIVVLEHQDLVNPLDGIQTILYATRVINKEIKGLPALFVEKPTDIQHKKK